LRNALFVDLTNSIIEKTAVMMRTTTEENLGLKGVLVLLRLNSSFEALVFKQEGIRIVAMAQIEK
jgi:hypothetical protein